ncbi:MAG: hypothetical protein IPJ88_06330 [Myxococcales bacterium]|nr:MAG: hypothetical protein IPJ88_06330 [Myxococcales bacterium]
MLAKLCGLFFILTLLACSNSNSESDNPDSASGCSGLCTTAGFDSGDEMDFGGGLVECYCSGAGTGIAKTACETYCATFDVSAEHALLSTDTVPDDKCVCDGTSSP